MAGRCRLSRAARLPDLDPAALRGAPARREAGTRAGKMPLFEVRFGRIDLAQDWHERMAYSHAVRLIAAIVNPVFGS